MKGFLFNTFVLFLLSGCQSNLYTIDQLKTQYALSESSIESASFTHRLFFNRGKKDKKILHVYLGGDGIPWVNGRIINDDPTPHYPLAVQLMAVDPQQAVYIARPCYFIKPASQPNCVPDLWAEARYSRQVNNSIINVINQIVQQQDIKQVVLIGYSGGGSIASIIANEVNNLTTLVTVSANLDIKQWTNDHNYLALKQSDNPYQVAKIPPHVQSIHLSGGQDKNVDESITRRFVEKHGGTLWHYKTHDHRCCWFQQWPHILERIQEFEKAS